MFVASHLRNPSRDRTILAATLLALAALAWLSLWVWAASPYGRYLHHEGVPGFAAAGSATAGAGFHPFLRCSTTTLV